MPRSAPHGRARGDDSITGRAESSRVAPGRAERTRLDSFDAPRRSPTSPPAAPPAAPSAHGTSPVARHPDTIDDRTRALAREMRLAARADLTSAHLHAVAPRVTPRPSPTAVVASTEATSPTFTPPATTPAQVARATRLIAGILASPARTAASRDALTLTTAPVPAHAPDDVAAEVRGASMSADDLRTLLDASDARVRFAARVAASIEGGRAAIVRPLVRERLIAAATSDGILPFDANLVVALVQDAARQGHLPTLVPALQSDANSPRTPDSSALGIERHLQAVVASTRVAPLLPLVRTTSPAHTLANTDPRSGFFSNPIIQAALAAALAALLLVGMVASLGT